VVSIEPEFKRDRKERGRFCCFI